MVPNFVTIGHTVPEISPFFDFQDGGRPPPWICERIFEPPTKMYSLVFIVVQNSVGIGAVSLVLIHETLIFCTFGLEISRPIHAPKNWGFCGFLSRKRGAITTESPKGISL